MNTAHEVSRRGFLRVSVTAGAGLVVGIYLSSCREMPTVTPEAVDTPLPVVPPTVTPELPPFEPSIWIKIAQDNTVTLTVHRSEMGQGVRTALAMILADELGAEWNSVHVETALAATTPLDQFTGGSTSVVSSYQPLRQAAAIAREMLIAAAAQTWGIDKAVCKAESGAVIDQSNGQRLTFGELIGAAASVPMPAVRDVVLKEPTDFRIIGTRVRRTDSPQIVTGEAIYGLDVTVPDMLYATIARCPVVGGTVASFDASAAGAVPGVRQVVQISNGIAVVAESTWAAIKGRQALTVTWDEGKYADLNDDGIGQLLLQKLAKAHSDLGITGLAGPSQVEALYEVPCLAHATMEPMNCTADVRADACEVWAPTQSPQDALTRAFEIAGLPPTVHTPLIGCGLGRRAEVDYVEEAVEISRTVGAPVKVVWTREDDIQHDYYRPRSLHWLRADLDDRGLPASWTNVIVGHGLWGARACLQGTDTLPYRFAESQVVRAYVADVPIPTGIWRAVYNNNNAFAIESFIDELAAAGGWDPLEYRLELVGDSAMAEVLRQASDKAGWGSSLPSGQGRGLACWNTWGMSDAAEIAEVAVADDGTVSVRRVVCAIDCGLPINPLIIEQQMESGLMVGLTAALRGEINFEKGRAKQGNFHDYPLLRMDEVPVVETTIIQSNRPPQGVGEMGVPPIAPAVANAVFAATGKRIRRLPMRAKDLQGG